MVELRVIVVEMNVEMSVEMVMLNELVPLPFLFLLFILLIPLFLINLTLLFQLLFFLSHSLL
jgi:hypothetical protein